MGYQHHNLLQHLTALKRRGRISSMKPSARSAQAPAKSKPAAKPAPKKQKPAPALTTGAGATVEGKLTFREAAARAKQQVSGSSAKESHS